MQETLPSQGNKGPETSRINKDIEQDSLFNRFIQKKFSVLHKHVRLGQPQLYGDLRVFVTAAKMSKWLWGHGWKFSKTIGRSSSITFICPSLPIQYSSLLYSYSLPFAFTVIGATPVDALSVIPTNAS